MGGHQCHTRPATPLTICTQKSATAARPTPRPVVSAQAHAARGVPLGRRRRGALHGLCLRFPTGCALTLKVGLTLMGACQRGSRWAHSRIAEAGIPASFEPPRRMTGGAAMMGARGPLHRLPSLSSWFRFPRTLELSSSRGSTMPDPGPQEVQSRIGILTWGCGARGACQPSSGGAAPARGEVKKEGGRAAAG